MRTLIISNEKIKHVLGIVKYLQESGLSNKDVGKAIENKAKEQKVGFFDILLGRLGDSILENMIVDQGVIQASKGSY